MIPHQMGLPKVHYFLLGSLIPPKDHFGGADAAK